MIFIFVIFGLILCPLALEFGFYPIVRDTITDYRSCKLFLALLTIVLVFVFQKDRRFLWLRIFIAYLILHSFFVTPLSFTNSTDQLIFSLWSFKPLFYVLIYYLFFCALLTVKWTRHKKLIVLSVMMWVGFACAVYLIMQYFGLDDRQSLMGVYQFQAPRPASDRLASFLSHPNYSGTFIALCLPAAVYFRQFFMAVFMIIAVGLSSSLFAIGAMIGGMVCYWHGIVKSKLELAVVWSLLFICLIVAWVFFPSPGFFSDNGRFHVWSLMFQDLKQSPIFGFGFGSFPILFQSMHKIDFSEAHNELFQIIYETGIVGGLLFLKMGWEFIKLVIKTLDCEIRVAFFCSLVTIILSSLGLFPFQIEPHRYFTVVIIAILESSFKNETYHSDQNENVIGQAIGEKFQLAWWKNYKPVWLCSNKK